MHIRTAGPVDQKQKDDDQRPDQEEIDEKPDRAPTIEYAQDGPVERDEAQHEKEYVQLSLPQKADQSFHHVFSITGKTACVSE
jgi:hypothetical protein